MSTPTTKICICSGVPLNSRYEHSIYFDSVSAQSAYFASKIVREYNKVTYCRKSWPLQVEATMTQARTWNYLYFYNGETGKVYYYFITNIEYKNDANVVLTLELDVLQTYMFDYDLLPCFVERQHTETDGLGEHTLDEGLEVGELYDVNSRAVYELSDLCILVLASINPNEATTEEPVKALSGMYDKVFSGLKLWAVNSTQWAAWGSQLDGLSAAGFLDGIISMWMYPKALVTLGGENTWGDDDLCKTVAYTNTTAISVPALLGKRAQAVDGYTPHNNKLYCYPFRFVYVSNNAGSSAVYRYERNEEYGVPQFMLKGSATPEGTVFMWPRNYNGTEDNYEQGMTLGNFPTCAWDADVYKMWLAQNQNQHKFNTASANIMAAGGVVAAIGGLATGSLGAAAGGIGAMMGAVQQVQGQMAQKADMAIQPPQARGNFSTSINVAMGNQTFRIYEKQVGGEQAKRLDAYFDMYGYKLSTIRTPNRTARPRFTYIKTVGCHISSRLCNEDAVQIERIYDTGLTWWRNAADVGNYSDTVIMANQVSGGE